MQHHFLDRVRFFISFGILTFLYFSLLVDCYTIIPIQQQQQHVTIKTALSSWSLPTDPTSFVTLKSTWYNEYNPTARTTVYNDPLFSTDNYFVMALRDDDIVDDNNNKQEGNGNINKRRRRGLLPATFRRVLRRRALKKHIRNNRRSSAS